MKLYPERLNKAYDRMAEPKRFMVAMALVGPAFVLPSLSFWLAVASAFWLGLIGFLRSAYLCKLEWRRP